MAGNSAKAVRDLTPEPEILKLSGRECIIREISDSSFLPELENKLEKELKKYLESKELADLLEVIYRIAEIRGSSKTKLETIRQRKKQEKGGFEKNLLLLNLLEEGSHPELSPIGSSKSRRVVFKLAHFTPLKPCLRFFPTNQLNAQ